MIRQRQNKGFTLIEVTLAIVIGIIMIAGATLIYNQAKTSAGNSRAQAKVVGLQQLVEEYAAQNQGIYPSAMMDVNALWKRKRPDDWNKSPWGGVLGSSYQPLDREVGVGVANVNVANTPNILTAGDQNWLAERAPGDSDNPIVHDVTSLFPTLVGGLFYDYDKDNLQYTYGTDIMTNGPVTVKGYAVYIADQQGRYPNFVTGGKANN